MTKCKKKSTEINPQSILMNLFFQRGGRWRWKERRRKYEEPVQRHITGCVWQGHKGCLWCLGLSGALPGGRGGGGTYAQPRSISRRNRQRALQGTHLQRGPCMHREQVQRSNSCCIDTPFLPLHSLLQEASEIKARLPQGHLLSYGRDPEL